NSSRIRFHHLERFHGRWHARLLRHGHARLHARQDLRHFHSGHGHRAGEFSKPANHRGAPAQVRREAMNFTFRNKRISGMLAVVPARELQFLDEMKNFNAPESRSRKLNETMCYDRRRLVEHGVCVSDLAVFGLKHLFDKGWLRPEEIDALILITQTPDHFMPPTSNI